MGQLNRVGNTGNVNVTLEPKAKEPPFVGRHFPCCICADALELKATKKGKPCCTCNKCGIQIFFRGKPGIAYLIEQITAGKLVFATKIAPLPSTLLFNEIAQLSSQKRELEAKQGVIFEDLNLTNAISAIDNEIERKQIELAKLGKKSVRGENR